MGRNIIFLVLVSIVIYAVLKLMGGEDKSTQQAVLETLSVTVTHPVSGTFRDRLNVTGMLVPRDEFAVTTEVSGVRVKELFVDVGQRVEKGEVLGTLDTEGLELQVAQAESEYVKARDEYMRIEPIKNTGAVSKQSVIEKKAAMESAQARMDDTKLAVRRANVIAPEAGIIYERQATLGALVNNGEPLFRIAWEGKIEAQLSVPEAHINKLHVGQPAKLTVTGIEGDIEGEIRLVTPQVDPANRSAQVRVSLESDTSLIIGSFVKGEITLKEEVGLTLPATAIQEDAEGKFVWSIGADKKAKRQAIRLVSQQDGLALIEGIAPDLSIIAKAGSFVKAGDTVKPVEEK